jgi:hypothetical protein
METQKKAANRGRRERSPKQEYLKFVNWCPEGEEEGILYRRPIGTGGMNLDITVNAPQVVTVAVKTLSYCRGLRATGNCHD